MWHGTSRARPRIQCSTWPLPWSSSFWLLAFPSSVMFPELERSIDFSLMAEHPTVIYYLCFGQLHISVITSEHCKKKLLWLKLTAVWYGNKHSGLDGNFMGRFCLQQHVDHMEVWLFHDMLVCARLASSSWGQAYSSTSFNIQGNFKQQTSIHPKMFLIPKMTKRTPLFCREKHKKKTHFYLFVQSLSPKGSVLALVPSSVHWAVDSAVESASRVILGGNFRKVREVRLGINSVVTKFHWKSNQALKWDELSVLPINENICALSPHWSLGHWRWATPEGSMTWWRKYSPAFVSPREGADSSASFSRDTWSRWKNSFFLR